MNRCDMRHSLPATSHHWTFLISTQASPNFATNKGERPNPVKKEILVLDGDPVTGKDLGQMLSGQAYRITQVMTVKECEAYLQDHACCALIVDLDTVALDNRMIGQLKKKHPGVDIFAKSLRPFHPELEESLRRFIFACLAKPLDADELKFWLKSLTLSNGGA